MKDQHNPVVLQNIVLTLNLAALVDPADYNSVPNKPIEGIKSLLGRKV
jgi:hypothetical protein